ncbi:MAG TPA: hypothetical protein VF803_03250 [Candidatus Paceibacterota bacterium]
MRNFLITSFFVIAIIIITVVVWRTFPFESSEPTEIKDTATTSASSESVATVATTSTQAWATYTDSATGATFRFPQDIGTMYIHPIDWPPHMQVIPGALTCTTAGSEAAPGGKTVIEMIGGTSYCVTKETQGAAGNLYTQYAYAFQKDGDTVILTFSLSFAQCVNYISPQADACSAEENAFTMDTIMSRVASTVVLR